LVCHDVDDEVSEVALAEEAVVQARLVLAQLPYDPPAFALAALIEVLDEREDLVAWL
jgi:predicted RNA polymerase sigma factor